MVYIYDLITVIRSPLCVVPDVLLVKPKMHVDNRQSMTAHGSNPTTFIADTHRLLSPTLCSVIDVFNSTLLYMLDKHAPLCFC